MQATSRRAAQWGLKTSTLLALVGLSSAGESPATSAATISFASLAEGLGACGTWLEGTKVTIPGVEAAHFVCEGGSSVRTFPASEIDFVTRNACKQWCSSNQPADEMGSSCCQLRISPNGDECTWTNGRPTLAQVANFNEHSVAMESCADGTAPPAQSADTPAAARSVVSELLRVQMPQAMQASGPYECALCDYERIQTSHCAVLCSQAASRPRLTRADAAQVPRQQETGCDEAGWRWPRPVLADLPPPCLLGSSKEQWRHRRPLLGARLHAVQVHRVEHRRALQRVRRCLVSVTNSQCDDGRRHGVTL